MSDSQNRFGDLPVHPASWDSSSLEFPDGADFETSIEEWILRGEVESSVDEMMAGHPSPRIWLLLHEPGQGALSATAALALARELGSRDQGVLILDCDEADSTLTRWADRTGAEGWADLVRYGASVLTCGIRLPFPGRQSYLLGPGSYVPVDVLAEEIQQIIARLRRQADDILLVCPSGDTGRRWAPAASIRLLCRDASSMAAGRVGEITGAFAAGDTPLTGMIRFGEEPADGAAAAPEAETAPADEPAGDLPEPDAAFGFDAGPDEVPDEVPEEPAEELETDEPVDEDDDGSAAAALATLVEQEEQGEPEPDSLSARPGPDAFARKRGTSRVFWWVALGAIALISMSVWYYREYVVAPLPSPAADRPVELAAGGDAQPTVEETDQTADPSSESATDPAGTDADATATGPDGDAAAGAEDRDPAAGQTPAGEAVTEAGVDAGGETVPETVPETTPKTVQPAEQPESTPEPADADEGFQMDPYLTPVGQDGWALHIYSFPDPESVQEELAILERKGFRTETRIVEIKGKGRWHRIYLGSFLSKQEAQEALPLLLKELREDWGRPTQF